MGRAGTDQLVRFSGPPKEMGGSGRYINAEGQETAANVWGKTSAWVAIRGAVKDKTGDKDVTVAIYAHPKSFNSPPYWHARDYGLFAANPFGAHAYDPKAPERATRLPAGESLHLRYRLAVYSGKVEKSRLIRWIKLFEIAIMIIGLAGFWQQSLTLMFAALALLGIHSALFGPVKYAILPQHLKPEELIGGNGLVEMGTFVAILLGTIAGGLLVAIPGNGPLIAGLVAVAVAMAGYIVSRGIPHTPAVAPRPQAADAPMPARSVASKSDLAIGPMHGEVAPAER